MTVEQNPKEKKKYRGILRPIKIKVEEKPQVGGRNEFFVVVVEGGKGGTQPVACQLLLS